MRQSRLLVRQVCGRLACTCALVWWQLLGSLSTHSFSQWCNINFLELNVSKTKELVIDPRRGDHPAEPVKVNGQNAEVVDSFKYLGLTLDYKLSSHQHIISTQRKSQQRLKSFHLRPKLLLNLYRSIIEPILTYCTMIFLSSVSVSEKNKLLKVANTASKITALPVPSLSEITERAVLFWLLPSNVWWIQIASIGSPF